MVTKVQYQNAADRQTAIDNNKDKFLIEEQILLDGNYLIFSDIKPIEFQINDINNTVNMVYLKQEGII